MQCPRCQAANPDDANFCGECGMRLATGTGQAGAVSAEVPLAPPPSAPASPPPAPLLPPDQLDPPYGMASYAPGKPRDNTSGSGPQAILPDESSVWTFAGFIPFGIYCFGNNLGGWGLFGCFSQLFFPLLPVYWLVIGISGRQMAWKNRAFSSLEQYCDTMKIWNLVGIISLVLGILSLLIWGFTADELGALSRI